MNMKTEQAAEPEVSSEQLRQEILTEKKGSVPEGKQPWELRLEEDHPNLVEAPVKKEKEVEEPAKEDTEDKPSGEEQPAEEESAPVEEQPEESEGEPVKTNEDTAKEDAYAAEYAKKTGITMEEAKEEITSLKAIASKYQNDPVKLAKAYLSVQSAYDKQKVQASSNVNPAVAAIAANPRSYIAGEVKKDAEKLITEFRTNNPARSRDMDDEQVEEEIVERGTFAIKEQIRGYELQLKKEAFNKRDEYIRSVSETDRKYITEVKSIMEQLPDYQIISPTFRFEDLVTYARGKDVKNLIKEAEDRIHKQYASKDRKIVGEIAKAPQTTKVKQTPQAAASSTLSKWDQDQAKQMYASSSMSDEEKFEAYIDLKKAKKTK